MSSQLLEIQTLSWRWFLHSKRRPMVLMAGIFQPFIWLLLFSAVFKNSPMANISGFDSYLGFITPGTLVFTAFTGALNGGVPILFDRELGFLDRLLVAPLRSRFSIIWATGFHIFVMTLLQCAIIMLLTWIMGVHFSGGLLGFGLLILIIGLVSLFFTTLSLMFAFSMRRHFELISVNMILSLPMVFMSTAFAPITFMPTWLKWLVSLNPITLAVEPLRALYANPDWSFGQVVFEAPYAGIGVLGCIIVLAVLNLALAAMAKGVIVKKLN